MKDNPSIAAGTCHPATALQDLARIGGIQPGDDVEQGGFAAAGGPDQDDEFAVLHIQPDLFQRLNHAAARLKPLRDSFEGELCHDGFPKEPIRDESRLCRDLGLLQPGEIYHFRYIDLPRFNVACIGGGPDERLKAGSVRVCSE